HHPQRPSQREEEQGGQNAEELGEDGHLLARLGVQEVDHAEPHRHVHQLARKLHRPHHHLDHQGHAQADQGLPHKGQRVPRLGRQPVLRRHRRPEGEGEPAGEPQPDGDGYPGSPHGEEEDQHPHPDQEGEEGPDLRSQVDGETHPMNRSRFPRSRTAKSVIRPNIQLPAKKTTVSTATILGTNARVCSWIWVTAWSRLTTTPTTRAASRMGPAAKRMVCTASRARSVATPAFTWTFASFPHPPRASREPPGLAQALPLSIRYV